MKFCASAVGVGNVLWSVVGRGCCDTSSGVVCDVGVVLVWCWCSGVVVGGSVVVWWWVVEVEAIRSRPATAGFPLRDVTLIFIWRWRIAAQILILLWWYLI